MGLKSKLIRFSETQGDYSLSLSTKCTRAKAKLRLKKPSTSQDRLSIARHDSSHYLGDGLSYLNLDWNLGAGGALEGLAAAAAATTCPLAALDTCRVDCSHRLILCFISLNSVCRRILHF